MSSDDVPVNIDRLLTTFNIEMRALPDDLKCAQCKSVLKDACQVPCGCRFCRTCIDHVVARGGQFCPRGSQMCGRTPLSTVQRDFRANRSIMKLTAKCPHAGCTHECPLADMEGHLRVCPRKSVDCPFRELGCPHGGLAAADMSTHMQQENGSHSEILIGLVAGIKRDMEMLKDEQMRHLENENKWIKEKIKLIKDENKLMKDENESIRDQIKSIFDDNKAIKDENKPIREQNDSMKNEIRSIKIENELIKSENESIVAKIKGEMDVLKQELVMKDEQGRHMENEIKLILDEIKFVKDENKAIKDENKKIREENKSMKIENESIKREKEVLSGKCAVTGAVASNKDTLCTEIEPVRGDIRSMKEQLDSMTCQMESIRVPVGLGQLDDWQIDVDVGKTEWWSTAKSSGKFRGEGRPYTYELSSWNYGCALYIRLRIWAGPSDAQLQWPFRGAVTITVAHRDNAEKCMRQTQQCQIERPQDNRYRRSKPIIFEHAALRGAGLDLERGVRVSCQIVPGAGQ